MDTLDVDQRTAALLDTTETFVDVVGGLDPSAGVPTCPEWRVRDLVAHIGQADRWAAALVRSGEPDAVPDPRSAEPGPAAMWPAWLRASAVELVDAVAEVGLDAPVWTFLGPRKADFWLRRMLNDLAVHVVDAAIAAGREHSCPAGLAADVITEGLEMLASPDAETLKPELAVLRGRGETMLLRPTDPGLAGWRVTRTPDGPTFERGDRAADVELRGAVRDLMPVFSRRVAPDDSAATVIGDRALLDHWLAATAF